MASLSVRAFAELLRLPAVQQVRILHDQKYPTSEPQSFRVPYYQPAMKGLRAYYRSDRNPAALQTARATSLGLMPAARRDHNVRVLDQFAAGPQFGRTLLPVASPRFSTMVSGVTIRLQFDLVANEADSTRHILYNLRNELTDPDVARSALEIAYWVLQRDEHEIPMAWVEHIEISTGSARRINSVRKKTLQSVEQNANLIRTIWPTI